jgi:hypothetical protein
MLISYYQYNGLLCVNVSPMILKSRFFLNITELVGLKPFKNDEKFSVWYKVASISVNFFEILR